MRAVDELETGVMFWAGGDPLETLRGLKGLGANAGQIGIPGDFTLDGAAAPWKAAIEAEDFAIATVFAAYSGEDYADIPTVERTVGWIPPAFREEREQRTYAIIEFAAAIGAPGIALHVGFVPEDTADPNYQAVKGMVQRVCDAAASHGQTFALETGQEPAETLLHFFEDVNRDNLRINFDPANMILYGTGDPIEALKVLAKHVVSVHCKDGDWPPKDFAGALGTEKPLGQGSVGIPRYIETLKEVGYRGILAIEREGVEPDVRLRDVKAGIELLNSLK